MFHFHNNRSRVLHNTYHFWYLNNNHLSRLLIILAGTPTFLTTVLGEGDLVCHQTHTEIFSSCQYSFSAFPMNFKNWPRWITLFVSLIWHILTCLHTKVVLLTIANFFQICYESLYSFSLFSCTIATILPSAVLLDFSEDGTRGHTLEFYISSRRGEKKDIWSQNDIHWRFPREDNTCFCLSPARHAKSVQW